MDFDFSNAERLAPLEIGKLVFHLGVEPHWLGTSLFWYRQDVRRDGGDHGKRFLLVNTETGHIGPAFDHDRLAATLTKRLHTLVQKGVSFDPENLPFDEIELSETGDAVVFEIEHQRWRCTLDTYACRRIVGWKPLPAHEIPSPDGCYTAFLRGHNLFVRSLETEKTRQLTTDGQKDYNYASRPDFYGTKTVDELQGRKPKPAILWSPDSTRILTHRLDERKVRKLPVMQYVPDGSHAPAEVRMVHYPLPGDEHVQTVEHVILGVDGSRVDLHGGPIEIYNTDALIGPFWHNIWWSGDGTAVYYIRPTRGCESMQFWAADAKSGRVRQVLEEHGAKFYDQDMRMKNSVLPDVRVLERKHQFIWPSQRDGWYHLYLHDLKTGREIRPLTEGNWVVRELLGVDESDEWVYFLGGGRENGRDPYLRHLYRVRLDGSDLTLLTPEDAEHDVHLSPDCRSFVDTYSRVDQPPISVLRRTDGTLIRTLEQADVELLLQAGFVVPEPFTVKADDGETDLYGILIRPAHVEAGKRYPLIDYEYGGPQTFITPKGYTVLRGWDRAVYGQALAQLGFAGMIVDGRGTPGRSKAFHDHFSRLGDAAGLIDHVAAARQLAERYPFIDIDRVGMYGFSGGGYGSARAILTWPEFYKVAVACCGDHDNRLYDTTWWDRYMGVGDVNSAPAQDNQSLAERLQGKLLLMHGDVDDNVHPALTMRLADALMKADKEFDMLLLPNRGHALARDSYVMHRVWAYFLRHL